MPQSLFDRLENLLDEVGGTSKTAADEPGGNGATGGDTQSVTKKVDDALNPTPAKTGDRAAEMSGEVKDMGAASIDAAPDAKFTDAESRVLDIGLKATGVGNDPAQEDNYGGTLKEPGVGTSTDAKFDDGRKYAQVKELMSKSAADQRSYIDSLANSILVDIAAGVQAPAPGTKTAADKTAATTQATGNAAAEALIADAQAGYELAAVLGMEKMSAEQRSALVIEEALRDGLYDADLVAQYLHKISSEDEGSSEESAPPKEEKPPGESAPPSPGGEGGGPAAGGGGGEPGVPSDAAISQAIDSVAGSGAGAPPAPGGGGMPGGAPGGMPGGAPGGAPGGMPGMPPEMGGGQVGREEMLQEILMAMQELGITPEELLQVAGAGGAGQPQAQKIASAAKAFQRSGKFKIEHETTKRARHVRDYAKAMLLELLPN